ncbi:MAG: polysaccharide deacetylase [Geminicoccaceae bacterium]|nr:polysaccharide deacetylase [Geminicoccaceae bacterium]
MKNVMSIDVEDWFCVYNLSRHIRYADWDSCESRVERNTLRLLNLFGRNQVEATFFVLGWVAERFPDLVKEIERQGHEVATHGYSHRLLTLMTPEEFRTDLQRSLDVLGKSASSDVLGFRAPSFSLTRETLWAVRILKEAGIQYDSSVFPVAFHPEYGGRPVIFYLHPWEIDPDQPRVRGMSWSTRYRHYNNLERTEDRLEQLMEDFAFTSARRLLSEDHRAA